MKNFFLSLARGIFIFSPLFLASNISSAQSIKPALVYASPNPDIDPAELGDYYDVRDNYIFESMPGAHSGNTINNKPESWIVAQNYFDFWYLISDDQVTLAATGATGGTSPSCIIKSLKHLESHILATVYLGEYKESSAGGYNNSMNSTFAEVSVTGYFGATYGGVFVGVTPNGSAEYLCQ